MGQAWSVEHAAWFALLVTLSWATPVATQEGREHDCAARDGGREGVCDVVSIAALPHEEPPSGDPRDPGPEVTLLFFWGVACPHCEQAKPFVEELENEERRLRVDRVEVRDDRAGRVRFIDTMRRLGAQAVGIPTFVVGERYVVGFQEGVTEDRVRAMVEEALTGDPVEEAVAETAVALPTGGEVDAERLGLPLFTVVVGLVDGLNPCAMWVLLVLLGILSHVRSKERLAWVAGTFVVMSGVVYFIFMTAWFNLFQLMGMSEAVTVALGAVVLSMGLINLKEVLWFKRGPSLTIPDRVKPKLYRRMRAVANATRMPAAIAGVAALAFFVNLIELACTVGLPAVYTRVLSLHDQLSVAGRYAYLVLYNVAYVVPLAVVVVAYAFALRHWKLSERGAKVLKGVSGVLLVLFGGAFMFRPGLLT